MPTSANYSDVCSLTLSPAHTRTGTACLTSRPAPFSDSTSPHTRTTRYPATLSRRTAPLPRSLAHTAPPLTDTAVPVADVSPQLPGLPQSGRLGGSDSGGEQHGRDWNETAPPAQAPWRPGPADGRPEQPHLAALPISSHPVPHHPEQATGKEKPRSPHPLPGHIPQRREARSSPAAPTILSACAPAEKERCARETWGRQRRERPALARLCRGSRETVQRLSQPAWSLARSVRRLLDPAQKWAVVPPCVGVLGEVCP